MFNVNKNKPDIKVKCITFPSDLETKITKICKSKGISYTKFVIEACKYALDNMKKQ